MTNSKNPLDLSWSEYDPVTNRKHYLELVDGKKVRQTSPNARLFEGIANNDIDMVREALEQKADPNCRDEGFGKTPLHEVALCAGFLPDQGVAMASLLIGSGANRQARDGTLGWTAYQIAKEYGHDKLGSALNGPVAIIARPMANPAASGPKKALPMTSKRDSPGPEFGR